MALALYDRVQQTGTANTTVSFTLSGSVTGFQDFTVVGNGNTTYYAATDASGDWEVGLGTYSSTGPTLTRTTIFSSSNSGSAVTFSGVVNVFITYPSEQSVNLDASGNVSPLGTIASGTWQGTAIGTAYGGTGATSATAGFANLNGFTTTVSSATTVTLTNASTYLQIFTGTIAQTVVLPVTSTLQTGWAFKLVNNTNQPISVQSSGLNVITSLRASTSLICTCIGTTLTTAADWDVGFTDFATVSGDGAAILSTNSALVNPTATGILAFSGTTTSASSFHTTQTTGTCTLGGTAGTGLTTIGRSTVSQQTDIQAGATASGSTKTINLGTGGLAGSTTDIEIGSTTGTSITTLNGTVSFANPNATLTNLTGFATTATAAGTTTLTNTSASTQLFTGTTTQTIVLPVTSTLALGWTFRIVNNSTGSLSVQSSGGNAVITVLAGTAVVCTCIGTTLTTAADWEDNFSEFNGVTGTGSAVLNGNPSISSISVTGVLSLLGNADQASSFHTTQTTGTCTLGGTSGTGLITLGRATTSQQTDIQAGATASGSTKTVNIGTGGLAGSTTDIAIGSTTGTSATTLNGTVDFQNPSYTLTNLTGFTTTVGSATPINLTTTSTYLQIVTGNAFQTFNLPVASTLTVGWSFKFVNNMSSNNIGIFSSGGNTVGSVIVGQSATVTCVLASGTTAASWEYENTGFSTLTGTGAVVLAGNPSISSVTITGILALTGNATQASSFHTTQTSGSCTLGGTGGTGGIILGQSTASQTTSIQAGATASGATKLMNIGTGGLAGSTTTINIGSTTGTSTITFNGVTKQQNYTVATLPSAATSGVGATTFVTDALTPTFGAAVVGGGAVPVPVFSDGTNWNVG